MSEDSETVRFDPAEFREDDAGRDVEASADTSADASEPAGPEDREFGWRGWVLVGTLFLAFGVVPLSIYLLPRVQGLLTATGLGYRDAYLVLPLVPALLLGALAVWATTRP